MKLVQGVPGGKHKLNLNEPQPEKLDSLAPPEELTESGKKTWQQMAARLHNLNLLTDIDTNALLRYCDIFEKWMQAKRFVDKNGFAYAVYEQQTDEQVKKREKRILKYMAQFPQVGIYNQLSRELGRLESQFGLTPSARASLSMGKGAGSVGKNGVKSRLYG